MLTEARDGLLAVGDDEGTAEAEMMLGELEWIAWHTVGVSATDAAQNTDATPATTSFWVCVGRNFRLATALDGVLRPISPPLADLVLANLCTG